MKWFLKLSVTNKLALVGIFVTVFAIFLSLTKDDTKDIEKIEVRATSGSNSPIVNAGGNVHMVYTTAEDTVAIRIMPQEINRSKTIRLSAGRNSHPSSISCEQDVRVRYPYIEVERNSAKEYKLNSLLKERMSAPNIIDFVDLDPESEFSGYCKLYFDYEQLYRVKNLLGFKFTYEYYGLGAAHGYDGAYMAHINLKNNSTFEYKDLFTAKGLKKMPDILSKAFAESGEFYTPAAIKEQLEENDVRFFFSVEDFCSFFVTNALDCSAAGSKEACVPLDDLVDFINPNGPLAEFR